jgi:hypothetical protein
LRHRQVRFPGTGRPDAEHDVVLFDRFEVTSLHDRLRRDLAAPRRCQAALQEVIAQIDRFILRDQCRGCFHICVRQLVAVAHQCRQLTDNSVDLLQTGRIAIYQQFVPVGADADVEERFEVLEVLVVGAEQRFNPFFGDGNAFH